MSSRIQYELSSQRYLSRVCLERERFSKCGSATRPSVHRTAGEHGLNSLQLDFRKVSERRNVSEWDESRESPSIPSAISRRMTDADNCPKASRPLPKQEFRPLQHGLNEISIGLAHRSSQSGNIRNPERAGKSGRRRQEYKLSRHKV